MHRKTLMQRLGVRFLTGILTASLIISGMTVSVYAAPDTNSGIAQVTDEQSESTQPEESPPREDTDTGGTTDSESPPEPGGTEGNEPEAPPEPTESEPEVTPEPTESEPGVTPEPTESEPEVTPEPTESEPEVTPEPTESEPEVTPVPTESEPDVTPVPGDAESNVPVITPTPAIGTVTSVTEPAKDKESGSTKKDVTKQLEQKLKELSDKEENIDSDTDNHSTYSYGGTYSSTSSYAPTASQTTSLFHMVNKKPLVVTGGEVYLNVRDEPSLQGRPVGYMFEGAICYDVDETHDLGVNTDDDTWMFVEALARDGKTVIRGYSRSDYLRMADSEDITKKAETDSLIRVSPKYNKAFYKSNQTTQASLVRAGTASMATASADRQEILTYGRQFIGNPYVWGGESLTEGTDCSGFTQQIYAKFGISLPRCSYEQAEAGEKIPLSEAKPGDLVFYSRDGVVYHVMLWEGDGRILHASSSTTGIIESNVNMDKVCWACRFIKDDITPKTSTKAEDLAEYVDKAAEGDTVAQQAVIEALAEASETAWEEYGVPKQILVAKAVVSSGWMTDDQAKKNNLYDLDPAENADKEENADEETIDVQAEGEDVPEEESVNAYADIEESMSAYAAELVAERPDVQGLVITNELVGAAANDAAEKEALSTLIQEYDLGQYDTVAVQDTTTDLNAADDTSYTQEQLELIWAIVAQEDDASYEGALAVITSAMNRADKNYGGYGTTALAQLTADGQYCYSPKVSDPSLWQRRLEGNVPEYVKEAVADCLGGKRSHDYLNFRSSNRTGNYIQIGANWYF